MTPNVFISSTIADLHHLREALRDTVQDLGYNPVLSEFGDIGYLPQTSAEDSCYITMKDCQLAVLIVGKRYGSLSDDGRSVTHNEFLTATATTIFPSATLSDYLGADGVMGGASVFSTAPFPADAYHFSNNGTTCTFQLQIYDGGHTKCVKI